MLFGMLSQNQVHSIGTTYLMEVQISLAKGQFWGKVMPWHARRHSAMSCAKIAEPIEMPFGLWIRVGPRKHVVDGIETPHAKEQF